MAEPLRPRSTPAAETEAKLALVVEAILDKKGEQVQVLDIRNLTSLGDFFVVASAQSERQVRMIAEGIDARLRQYGSPAYSLEGLELSRWVLVDSGDVIVHIFHQSIREFYKLERLWMEAPRLDPQPLAARAPVFVGKKA